MYGEQLFEQVLELCGFSAVLGPGILRRALKDRGVTPVTATTADYRAALPRLEARMRAYMPHSDAATRARRVAAYLAHIDDELGDEPPEETSGFGRSVEILREVRERLRDSTEIRVDGKAPTGEDDEKVSG